MSNPNPNYSFGTCLAHVLMAGTTGWTLKQLGNSGHHYIPYWCYGTFSFLLGHSLIGVLYFGHPHLNRYLQKTYYITALLAESITLPFINTELYLIYNFNNGIPYIHALSAIAPIIAKLVSPRQETSCVQVIDIILIGNISSLIYITVTKGNAWAGGLAILTALNHFIFRRLAEQFDVPKTNLLSVALCFFSIFALNTILEALDA